MLHVAKLKHALLPLTNMALRGFGLVGRFALSFYLIKFIGVVATGQFGLIIGIAGILPALCDDIRTKTQERT